MRRQRITRWVGEDGKRCPPGTPGAHKVVTYSRKYYAYDIPGSPRPIPLAGNRAVAQTLFARLVAGGEAAVAGLPSAEDRQKSVAALIAEYAERQRTKGNERRNLRKDVALLDRVAADLGWTSPAKLTAGQVSGWLADLVAGGAGPQTHNHYLTRIRAFTRWLAARPRRLLPPDLLDELPTLNVEVDVRRARRSLTVEELGRLLAVALDSELSPLHLDGRARHLLYSVACATGFRAQELGSLTPAHLHLDTTPPVIVLTAKRGKNRRQVRQPIPSDVAALLREYTANLDRDARIWPGSWPNHAAAVLREDLEATGIPYAVETPDGPLYADFHALRHTYVSLLEAAGVSLRDAMQLARHKDPRLTLARYGRSQTEALGRAVEGLPVVGGAADLTPGERILVWLLACAGIDPRTL